ncbi:putative phage tail protein [Metaclostridioides mangenotii]|uniref:DUF2313 domain-containing protein n=1 Tax=Metaclostridioides mangenotii TaxID=1540 RepID=A0ABS4E9N7_9FIRM|nr:putative phage tail protein [Clostridioides mangenotii]MBP1854642.1 hypothetical protein [Clostridioides mangenotii]
MLNKVNLNEYLPKYLREVKELKQITDIENKEFELLKNELNMFVQENFIDLMESEGLKRWEQILKIKPFASDTVEDRRFRIKSRLLDRLPYSLPSLRFRLDAMLGEGKYKLNIDYDKYILTLKLELTVKSQFNDVVSMLYNVLPANMLQHIELAYNQHQTFYKYTHAELQAKTHNQLREEVI